MKKLLSIFLLVASLQSFGQAPDINYQNPYTAIPQRLILKRLYSLTDSRGYSFLVRDTLGNIWNVWLPSIKASYWSGKQDSTTLSNDTLYDWRNGVAYFRAVIALPSGSGIPGGSAGQAQYYLTSTTFGGSSAATMDATHIWIPTLYGSSSSAGSLTLGSTSHATKGLIYLGADQLANYDETNHVLTIVRNGLLTTSASGYILQNNTASTSGSVQYPPRQHFHGSGWGSTAGTSQSIDIYFEPQVQTSSIPTADMRIKFSINGGAATTPFIFASNGDMTTTGNLNLGSGSTYIKGGGLFKMATGANSTTLYAQPANPFQFDWVGHNNAIVLNEGNYLFGDTIANQVAPNPNALVDFVSSQKPVALPRWTSGQRSTWAKMLKGAIAYDSTQNRPIGCAGDHYYGLLRDDTLNVVSGLQKYAANYGSTYDARTLVDKNYVDSSVAAVGSSGKIYVGTADAAAVTNTTTTTSIIGTGVGTLTFAANYFTAGKIVTIISEGLISTDATNPNIAIGGNIFGTAMGVVNWTTASLSNAYYRLELTGVVRSTGSSGTIYWTYHTRLNGIEIDNSTSVQTLNTTTSESISNFTATWTTASTNNSITGKTFIVTAQ